MPEQALHEAVQIQSGAVTLDGDLHEPSHAAGMVIFAHGSGSSRFSRQNRAVAGVLEASGFATFCSICSCQRAADD